MSIQKQGSKWALKHCHGEDAGKVIKIFDTLKKAKAMHRAIMANKYGKK